MVEIDKYLSEKELSQIFNLLKHPMRREIIKYLSNRPQTYSQIMKHLNVLESSILNYHLREMDDLLIKKESNRKYSLNEIGEICFQLILRVKEKEVFYSSTKLQIVIENLKSIIFFIQIILMPLVTFLILELYLLNIIDFGDILGIFASGVVFSVVLSMGVFIVKEQSKSALLNKSEKKEKFGTYSLIFTIWIVVQTIISLLW